MRLNWFVGIRDELKDYVRGTLLEAWNCLLSDVLATGNPEATAIVRAGLDVANETVTTDDGGSLLRSAEQYAELWRRAWETLALRPYLQSAPPAAAIALILDAPSTPLVEPSTLIWQNKDLIARRDLPSGALRTQIGRWLAEWIEKTEGDSALRFEGDLVYRNAVLNRHKALLGRVNELLASGQSRSPAAPVPVASTTIEPSRRPAPRPVPRPAPGNMAPIYALLGAVIVLWVLPRAGKVGLKAYRASRFLRGGIF